MSVHGCLTLPCPICHPSTSTYGMSSTFRMHESFDSWTEALAFALRLPPVKSKPRIHRLYSGWGVTYEPVMLTFNYAGL